MATWTYSDYITQTDDADRLSRLQLHIQEVADSIANPQSVNSSAHGMSRFDLQQYLQSLKDEEAQLRAALATGGGMGRVRFRRP